MVEAFPCAGYTPGENVRASLDFPLFCEFEMCWAFCCRNAFDQEELPAVTGNPTMPEALDEAC